jgi:hypothetical protein
LSTLGAWLFCKVIFDPFAVLGLSRVMVRLRLPFPLAQPLRGFPWPQSAVLFSRAVSFWWLTSNDELYKSQSERFGRHLFRQRSGNKKERKKKKEINYFRSLWGLFRLVNLKISW